MLERNPVNGHLGQRSPRKARITQTTEKLRQFAYHCRFTKFPTRN